MDNNPGAGRKSIRVDGNPHSGNDAAFFGAFSVGSYDQIQQTLATVAGQSYDLTFWLDQDGGVEGPPNNMSLHISAARRKASRLPSACWRRVGQ